MTVSNNDYYPSSLGDYVSGLSPVADNPASLKMSALVPT